MIAAALESSLWELYHVITIEYPHEEVLRVRAAVPLCRGVRLSYEQGHVQLYVRGRGLICKEPVSYVPGPTARVMARAIVESCPESQVERVVAQIKRLPEVVRVAKQLKLKKLAARLRVCPEFELFQDIVIMHALAGEGPSDLPDDLPTEVGVMVGALASVLWEVAGMELRELIHVMDGVYLVPWYTVYGVRVIVEAMGLDAWLPRSWRTLRSVAKRWVEHLGFEPRRVARVIRRLQEIVQQPK